MKASLIAGATEILERHAGLQGRIPDYIVIQGIPEANWGIFGNAAGLAALKASAPDETEI